MIRKKLQDAYDAMSPDEQTKETILADVLNSKRSIAQSQNAKNKLFAMHRLNPVASIILAVLVFGLLLPCAAYALSRSTLDNGLLTYEDILENYRTAIREDWDEKRCTEEFITHRCVKEPDSLGFCYLDLNGDGSDELLISDGTVVYDVYIFTERYGAQPKLTTFDDEPLVLCEDMIIKNISTDDAGTVYYSFCRLADHIRLETVEEVVYVSDGEAQGWYGSVDSDVLTRISESDAQKIMDSYQEISVPITLLIE